MAERCPNPYCDGYGWVRCDATATSNAYSAPVCKIGPHPPAAERVECPRCLAPAGKGCVRMSARHQGWAGPGEGTPYGPLIHPHHERLTAAQGGEDG